MLMMMMTKMHRRWMRRKEVRWVVEMTKMQTPIPTKLRSPRTILSLDINITQELTNTVHFQLQLHLTLHTPKYEFTVSTIIIQVHFARCVDVKEDLIENNLKSCIAVTIIEDRDAFRSEVPDLVSQEFNAQAPKIIEDIFKNYVQSNVIQVYPTTTTSTESTSSANLQQQLYFKMKRSLQDRANDPALWEVLKCKFEKSSTSNTSCKNDDIHSHHDDHKEDDAPPKGEKRVKDIRHQKKQQQQQWDAWVEKTVIDEDEMISKDETPELIIELQDVDKRVPTIFDYERMKATLNDALSNDVSRDY
ncbi:hypothetical protein Tco_1248859 [Tanacetum coccineum]